MLNAECGIISHSAFLISNFQKMSNKEEYKIICDAHPEIPVFSQHWWMSACHGDSWDVLIMKDKQSNVIATMPYAIFRKLGFKLLGQHEVSQHAGPYIFYPDGLSNYDKLMLEEKVFNDIICQLESLGADMYLQNFSPRVTQHLPFYWAGYKQYTRYTYRLPNIEDSEELFSRFCRSKQKHIRKAQRNGLTTSFTMPVDEFLTFHRWTYEQRGQNDDLDKFNCKHIIEEAIKAGQGALVNTRDAEGKLLSVFFLVWDSEWAYYIWTGIDQSRKNEGAPSLMLWDTFQFLKGKTKGFDFEGSMNQGIGSSHREFGAELVPFIHVHKYYSKIFKVLDYLRGTAQKR